MHNNPEIIEEVRNVIGNWSAGEAIIGNGYELFLPLIKEIHGNEIILIHLKRDKQSWLKSWKDNVKTFPDSHGNYSKSILPKIHRMAAYHFNECEIEEWRRWSLNRKASWYYDKTHYLVNKYKNDFKKYLFFETYQLSDPASSLEIIRSCSKRWCNKKISAHVNLSEIRYDKLSNHDRKICNRIYSQFDFIKFAKEPLLGELYFADKIIDGFKNRKSFDHSIISRRDLDLYLKVLGERILKIKNLLKKK